MLYLSLQCIESGLVEIGLAAATRGIEVLSSRGGGLPSRHDVAPRSLDIKDIESVITYDVPAQIELYLHRVGRTARAGTKGRYVLE